MPDKKSWDLLKRPVKLQTGEEEQLKWFEIPTYVEFVDELPHKPGTDKINYGELEKIAKQETMALNDST